ncbi:MAG: hypothetical protein KTR31_15375 [Myxococcales bacterium]|nr:hypothetical protein [Myxococcales bacterium]
MTSDRTLRWLLVVAVAVALGLPGEAAAYPWMIQHQYTTCSQCHVDPSGGSAMTPYGRAQTEVLLRSRYGEDVGEPGPIKDFLFGAVPLPDTVIAQADIRSLLIPQPGDFRAILMQADLRGGVQTDRVVAYASAGVVSDGARGARILSTEGRDNEFITPVLRDYWVGITPRNGLLIRAGRMNLPFGIRTDQHILFTRAVTRTTTNDDQQLGLAVAYEARRWRAELMGIAGNLHVAPDRFRERGYSGTFAYALSNRAELGLSSLVTSSGADVDTLLPTTRQAHGVFSRVSPVSKVALLGEADLLLTHAGEGTRTTAVGGVLDVHADIEAVQGLHIKAGGEFCDPAWSDDEASATGRGWAALQWFFAPHVNLRIDMMGGPINCLPDTLRPTGFAQLHVFL